MNIKKLVLLKCFSFSETKKKRTAKENELVVLKDRESQRRCNGRLILSGRKWLSSSKIAVMNCIVDHTNGKEKLGNTASNYLRRCTKIRKKKVPLPEKHSKEYHWSSKTIKQRNQRKSVLDYLVAVNPSIIDEV